MKKNKRERKRKKRERQKGKGTKHKEMLVKRLTDQRIKIKEQNTKAKKQSGERRGEEKRKRICIKLCKSFQRIAKGGGSGRERKTRKN